MSDTKLIPYLNFSGNTKTAMEFYHGIFGGKLELQTFGKAPGMDVPEGYEDKIIHAVLECEGITIMASETMPGQTVKVGNNVHLSLVGSDQATLSKIFAELSADGTVSMPLEKQYWGDTFGMCRDKFEILWMINISAAKQ